MRGRALPSRFFAAGLVVVLAVISEPPVRGQQAVLDTPNPSGVLRTITLDGTALDFSNPFFQSLGTNGRSCVSCHVPSTGWTISPAEVRHRFHETRGLAPIFRTNDGSDSPAADVSTVEARRRAFSMLLTRGLIPIGLPIPANAEFTLVGVDDPYGYASASELSLFRRLIPSTNLRFLTAVMWDGRESFFAHGHDSHPLGRDTRRERGRTFQRPEASGHGRDPDARAGGHPADR
jgi:hypothetical protein